MRGMAREKLSLSAEIQELTGIMKVESASTQGRVMQKRLPMKKETTKPVWSSLVSVYKYSLTIIHISHLLTRIVLDFVRLLPAELTSMIFSFVDHKTLLQCELVSKAWRAASASHHVWRQIFLDEQRPSGSGSSAFSRSWASGKGMGRKLPNQDWKRIFKTRKDLRQRWARGEVSATYLTEHQDSVYCVQFDENKIITGSRDQTIRVWDMKTRRCIKVIGVSKRGTSNSNSASISDALICSPDGTSSSKDSRASFDIASKRISSSRYHRASVLCLQFDSEILVSGSSDATCIIWSIADNYKPVQRLRHHSAAVLDLCLDSKYIVSCSKDTSLCVWDRSNGRMLKQLFGHRGPVNAVQMRGNLIVSASGDSLVKMWNLDTGKCIREFVGHSRGLACVQFSEDARLIVSGGNDQVIRVWDAVTGACLRELTGHRKLVRTLYLDSDNDRIISASYDMSIKVFSVKTGRVLLDFPMWHSSWILSAKADYRRIISTSQDSKTLILDFGEGLDGVHLLESS
jgi:F-box and WD-40 domain protein 1/11